MRVSAPRPYALAEHTRRRARQGVRSARAYGLALAVGVAVALTGCADVGPPRTERRSAAESVAGSHPPGPRLSASLVQQRSDVAERQVQVRVRNDGDAPITIGAVEVADARFDGVATRVVERTTTLDPGERVDVRAQLPRLDCAAPEEAVPTVTVEVEADGGPREVTVEATDPLGFVAPLHARECFGERLSEVAEVSLAEFRPSPPGQAATLVLEVTSTGAGTARLEAVDSTTLLTYDTSGAAAPHPLGIDVTADSLPTRLEVPLVPQRCDPHVVQEDKRGTVFTVDATVDGDVGEFDLAAPPEMKADILTWAAAWCGFGAPG